MRRLVRLTSTVLALVAAVAVSGSVNAEEAQGTRALCFGTGWFDFVQRHDSELEGRVEYRWGAVARSFRSIVVATMTRDSAVFVGAGVGYDVTLARRWVITSTFAPGYYRKGSGKDLGYPLEFRSQLELGYQFGDGYRFSIAISHISNAGLGQDNPGQESLTLAWELPLARRQVH